MDAGRQHAVLRPPAGVRSVRAHPPAVRGGHLPIGPRNGGAVGVARLVPGARTHPDWVDPGVGSARAPVCPLTVHLVARFEYATRSYGPSSAGTKVSETDPQGSVLFLFMGQTKIFNMRVVVASKNPVKIQAARTGFEKMFPTQTIEAEGISVTTGVSDQPLSSEEALQGSRQRAENASLVRPEADFWVGMEGGVEDTLDGMESFAWVVVKSRENRSSRARTGTFVLPHRVAELVRAGKELGEADDLVFGRSNSKQAEGAVGLLTKQAMTRAELYRDAVALALIPFLQENSSF